MGHPPAHPRAVSDPIQVLLPGYIRLGSLSSA